MDEEIVVAYCRWTGSGMHQDIDPDKIRARSELSCDCVNIVFLFDDHVV
jgi:hypothetical protein